MKRILVVVLVFCAVLLFRTSSHVALAQSNYVHPVPDCGKYDYDRGNNDLFVYNVCDIEITMKWTSPGNVWGDAHLAPAGRQSTGRSRRDVEESGELNWFVCPGNSLFEQEDGRPMGAHYKGPYRCRRMN
jgi:hypothetical protein